MNKDDAIKLAIDALIAVEHDARREYMHVRKVAGTLKGCRRAPVELQRIEDQLTIHRKRALDAAEAIELLRKAI